MGYRKAARFRYFPRHVVVSPPPGLLDATGDPRELAGMWRSCLMVARAAGLFGGAAVMHWYRVREGGPTGPDRYDQVRRSPAWRDLVAWSPHLHLIAYGRVDLEGVPPGWVVRVLGRLPSRVEVGKRIYYALSHTGCGPGHALRYFGECGYNKLIEDFVYHVQVPLKCLKCSAEMIHKRERVDLELSYPGRWQVLVIPDDRPPTLVLVARWFGTFKLKTGS